MTMYRWLLMVCFITIPFFSSAQDLDAKSPKEDKQVTRQQHKAEKKKEKKTANFEKSEAENLKHSEKMQTKEVRKRMKKSRKKADAFNNHGKDSFFKSLFRKKGH